jgi:hypothetical protein
MTFRKKKFHKKRKWWIKKPYLSAPYKCDLYFPQYISFRGSDYDIQKCRDMAMLIYTIDEMRMLLEACRPNKYGDTPKMTYLQNEIEWEEKGLKEMSELYQIPIEIVSEMINENLI